MAIDKNIIQSLLNDIESDRAEKTISVNNTDKFGQAICAFVNDYRNAVIAEALRVLGFVNRFSRGVQRVENDLMENGNGQPEFDLSLGTAFKVIERKAHMDETEKETEDVTTEVSDEMNNDLNPDDIASKSKATKHRPPLNFSQMGIPVGSTLTYNADPSISVTVIGDKRVEYLGEDTSLTAVTTKLLNSKYGVQPTPRWSYNGVNLQEIYDATYPLSEE